MEDRLRTLIGRTVHVEQPRLGRAPQRTEAFRVVDVIGLTGVLEPLHPTAINQLRPGVPLALHVEGGEPVAILDAVITDASPNRAAISVRLPRLPERREVNRHTVSFGATVQVIGATVGDEHPEVAATVVDLSPGGLRLATTDPIPAGERVFVSLAIPGELPVLATADVVGDPFVVGGRHHVRLTFSMIGDDERGRLVRHLAKGSVSYAIGRG